MKKKNKVYSVIMNFANQPKCFKSKTMSVYKRHEVHKNTHTFVKSIAQQNILLNYYGIAV